MKINSKVLSIPPYISTAWDNVASLHVESEDGLSILVVDLLSGQQLKIPGLSHQSLQLVFSAHEKYLEEKEEEEQAPAEIEVPFNFPMGEGMESLSSAMRHNPEQSDAPDLPPEMLEKISKVADAIGIDDNNLPEAEPHCNCVYCQIARAMHGALNPQHDRSLEIEEDVSDDDLKFKEWDIVQLEEKLHKVTNPLDTNESYQVFLGSPVGCTCGHNDCEHIKAVLNS